MSESPRTENDRLSSAEPFERLRVARKSAGFATAADASRYFGWKVPAYRHHENGTAGFAKHADTYATAFGTTPEWLLYGRAEPMLKVQSDRDYGGRWVIPVLGDDDDGPVHELTRLVEIELDQVLVARQIEANVREHGSLKNFDSPEQFVKAVSEEAFDVKLRWGLMQGLFSREEVDDLMLIADLSKMRGKEILNHPSVYDRVKAFTRRHLPDEEPLHDGDGPNSRRMMFFRAVFAVLQPLIRRQEAAAR